MTRRSDHSGSELPRTNFKTVLQARTRLQYKRFTIAKLGFETCSSGVRLILCLGRLQSFENLSQQT